MSNPIAFRPSETEKIVYLMALCTGEGDSKKFINLPTIDIYGNDEPWQVFDDIDDKSINFFTKLKLTRIKKSGTLNETSSMRLVGAGTWELLEGEHRLISISSRILGVMNRFDYVNNFNAIENKKWVLDEYSLADRFVKPEYQNVRFCTLWHRCNVTENKVPRTIKPMVDKFDRERNPLVKMKRSPGSDGKEDRYKLRDSRMSK